jgi:hypothetical protein
VKKKSSVPNFLTAICFCNLLRSRQDLEWLGAQLAMSNYYNLLFFSKLRLNQVLPVIFYLFTIVSYSNAAQILELDYNVKAFQTLEERNEFAVLTGRNRLAAFRILGLLIIALSVSIFIIYDRREINLNSIYQFPTHQFIAVTNYLNLFIATRFMIANL